MFELEITDMQEPNCLSTEEEFVQFMDNNDLLFHLTVEEVGKLLGYLEGHGFVLGEKKGKLFQGDLCYSNENVPWEEISIDDYGTCKHSCHNGSI